ncbi:MAG TPA: cyanophycin synthetase [Verrucomicrobiae bacterium]|nr:cyanophycin synthetase [Verrucomicrobiae bacterium]
MNIWRVPYPKFGNGPGLERVKKIANCLGVDLAAFGAQGVAIVGSNGKGSTAAICTALLQGGNGPVGLFTSPHLFDLNERFRINGEDIADEALSKHWDRVVAAINVAEENANVGGFEFLFLIAADWFAARGCTHTIWEAGIGGRLDPVRLIEARRVALTSLDLEHTQLLGDTLSAIARDKLDAAPSGARVFVGESCASERAAIEAHCAARGLQINWVGASHLDPPLPGAHQRHNLALALSLARDLRDISDEQGSTALATTRWPGRLEIINDDPLVVIDVGHTPAGVRAAREGFASLAEPGVLVCGASHDKDARDLIAALAPGFSTIICAAARHKGAAPAQIAAYASAANAGAEIIIAESVADARQLALSKARGRSIFVAGGLFLAAEFRAVHLGRDPASLAFF